MKKFIILILLSISILYGKDTISKKVFKDLQKAQNLIDKKNYNSAISILNPISKSLNPMEKTYAFQSLANIYINKNNYKKASVYYEKIVQINTLEKKDLDKIKFSLSKIYLVNSDYKKSLKYSFQIINSPHIKKSEVNENIALGYYYNNQFSKAAPYIKKVISSKSKKESWYKMLYSSYIQAKSYNKAIDTLKYMIKRYTKNESYWMQLISLYQTSKKYKKSLATLELAYNKNIINKSKNLMYLVNILFQNKLYNKAGLLLEKSINSGVLKNNSKNFNLLISSYLNAKNYKKTIKKLSTSPYGKTSKYQLILGNIYYNKALYNKAINTLKNYKFKNTSKQSGQAKILLALSFFELKDLDTAKKYLKKASLNSYEKRRAKNIAKSLGIKI